MFPYAPCTRYRLHIHSRFINRPEREAGQEIFLTIRQLYLDITVLRRQQWPKRGQTRNAAIISVLCDLIKHTGHPGSLYALFFFPVLRRHQVNLAKGNKSINRDIAKSLWLRATHSVRLLNQFLNTRKKGKKGKSRATCWHDREQP